MDPASLMAMFAGPDGGGGPDSSIRRASSDGSMFGTGWTVSTGGGSAIPQWVIYGGAALALLWVIKRFNKG